MLKERKLYYDFIRIIACFLVIVNHTVWMFSSYNVVPLSTWMSSNVIFFIAKMAVPLFVMLSGALLLGRQESYKYMFFNRILKIGVVLLVWGLIYSIYFDRSIFTTWDILTPIRQLIKGPPSVHLWYLYMLIGLYIMTPFIRIMVQNFKEKDFIMFIVIWVLYSSLLPFLRVFKPLEYYHHLAIPIFTGYIGYYILGYYLDSLEICSKKVIFSSILFFIGLIMCASITFVKSKALGSTSFALDNVLLFPIMLMSVSFFLLLKYLICKINHRLYNKKIKTIIVNISSKTFGIYLVHILAHFVLCKSPVYNMVFYSWINPIIGLIIYDLLVFISSYIVVTIISKIPLIKYFV